MRCASCGCSDVDCLVLDHVNDDGSTHRKEAKIAGRGSSGGRSYEALYAAGFPLSPQLQVLCANCNMKKEIIRKRLARKYRVA